MIAIDIGNSRIKWALFKSGEIVSHNAVEYDTVSFEKVLERECMPLAGNKVMISHVAGNELKLKLLGFLKEKQCADINFAETKSAECQISNSYNIVSSMGVDRWLAMIAAYHHPQRNQADAVCVIDCGTAITFDVVGSDGVHLGGLIMPGYRTMYGSLMKNTSNIQQGIDAEDKGRGLSYLASSTAACVASGCAQLIQEGVRGIIAKQQEKLDSQMFCIVTGGDGEALAKSLEVSSIYAPFLVLEGLRLVASNVSLSEK